MFPGSHTRIVPISVHLPSGNSSSTRPPRAPAWNRTMPGAEAEIRNRRSRRHLYEPAVLLVNRRCLARRCVSELSVLAGKFGLLAEASRARLSGGRTWWAHVDFTPINITPTILRKKFEDLPIRGAFCAPKSAKSVSQSRVGFHSRTNKGGRAHRRRSPQSAVHSRRLISTATSDKSSLS
jgi:hypothetical protein